MGVLERTREAITRKPTNKREKKEQRKWYFYLVIFAAFVILAITGRIVSAVQKKTTSETAYETTAVSTADGTTQGSQPEAPYTAEEWLALQNDKTWTVTAYPNNFAYWSAWQIATFNTGLTDVYGSEFTRNHNVTILRMKVEQRSVYLFSLQLTTDDGETVTRKMRAYLSMDGVNNTDDPIYVNPDDPNSWKKLQTATVETQPETTIPIKPM